MTTRYTKSQLQTTLMQILLLTEKYWEARGAAQTPARASSVATMATELEALVERMKHMEAATPITLLSDPNNGGAIYQEGYLPEIERVDAELAEQRQRPLEGDELENAVQRLIAKAIEIVLLYPAAYTPARQNRLWSLQYELDQGLAALPET